MNRFDWIKQAQQLQSNQQPFALVTVLRTQAPTSAKPGDKALVTADGSIHGWIGGGCAQPTVIKTVRQALTDGQPRNIRITPVDERNERQLDDVLEFGMACHSGGTLELFIDPVLPAPQLVIIGDSAVARALTQLAPRVGLDVQLIANHAQASDFPDARQVIATDDVEALSALHLHAQDVVVATQGRRDMQGLKAALHLKPSDIWFVASARKAGVLLGNLKASGEDSDAVDRIVAPAGAPIGAQTPEEIALSVLTNVVARQRARGKADQPASDAAKGPTASSSSVSTTSAPRATSGSRVIDAMDQALGGSCCGGV